MGTWGTMTFENEISASVSEGLRMFRRARKKHRRRAGARWGVILGVVILGAMLAAWLLGASGADAQTQAHASSAVSADVSASSPSTPSQQEQITDLTNRVSDLEEIVQLLLAPIAILIGILALGGALGIVFSLRDQRRLSQFHELAVSSEVSSQRRTELSYSSFLEESQKTLTLVNQTLDLAREATDQAAHTMERKAAASLASIEAKSRDLLQPLLDAQEFEKMLDRPDVRTDIETIAGELRAIEGYLLLQDIDLQPHSRFVKGMGQYLADDTNGALRTLRQAAQDSTVRQLQLFSIYWDAYLNIALGRYAEADQLFQWGEQNLPERALAHVEFDRMDDDTRFFMRAEVHTKALPLERFNALMDILAHLEKVSAEYHEKEDVESLTRTSHEIADTRSDLLTWIAYESGHLYEPLPSNAVTVAKDLVFPPDMLANDGTMPVRLVKEMGLLNDLSPAGIRAWALLQAEAIYAHEHLRREFPEGTPDLALAFGKAECDFMLGTASTAKCIEAYREVEQKAVAELGSHHEHRKNVELAQMVLVCACRLLHLYRRDPDRADGQDRNEESQVRNHHLRVQETLFEMRDYKLTVYSPLQRRPLSRNVFADEAQQIRDQALRGTR
jgi:hypothetical protein